VPAPAAQLPNSLVRLGPDALEIREERLLQGPAGFARGDPVASRLVQRVHHLAEHVELQLTMRGIADAHRRGAFISGQPRHLPLGQAPLAGNAIHDLQLLGAARHRPQQPLAPLLRLVIEASIHELEQDHRGVA